VWRERISWLQSSGLTVAAGSKELGVSVASVYHWKKLLAEALCSGQQQPTRRRRTIPATASYSEQAGEVLSC
jgi:transposase